MMMMMVMLDHMLYSVICPKINNKMQVPVHLALYIITQIRRAFTVHSRTACTVQVQRNM